MSYSYANRLRRGLSIAEPDLRPTAHALYHADANGNITCLIYTNQTIAARYEYDPFGNILSQSGPLAAANVYCFSSKEYHANAGLIYYGYRFYDPNLQRWANSDPISYQIRGAPMVTEWQSSDSAEKFDGFTPRASGLMLAGALQMRFRWASCRTMLIRQIQTFTFTLEIVHSTSWIPSAFGISISILPEDS